MERTVKVLKTSLTVLWFVLLFMAIALLIVNFLSITGYLNGESLLGVQSRLSFRYFFSFFILSVYNIFIFRRRPNSVDHLVLALCLSIVLMFDGFGNAYGLYSTKFVGIYYDRYMHLLLPYVAAVGAGFYYAYLKKEKKAIFGAAMFGALLVFQTTILFEVYEFYSDEYLGTNMVFGLHDTIGDIALDYIGCALAVATVYLVMVYVEPYKRLTGKSDANQPMLGLEEKTVAVKN